jgi:excisionase family DNA binding protein
MAPQKLYRVEEAADLLALKPSTLRKLVFQRRIAVCRPTRRAVRIPQAEIERIQRDGLTPRREEVR